jgi:hypothetical protein
MNKFFLILIPALLMAACVISAAKVFGKVSTSFSVKEYKPIAGDG